MKGNARLLAVLVPLALLGAAGPQPAARPDTTYRFPRIEFADEPPPMLSVLVRESPSELRDAYRVKLDRRLVGAVAEMHQIASGEGAGTVRASRDANGWKLEYETSAIGNAPELPSYRDVDRLLSAWGARLLRQYPLKRTAAIADRGDSIVALYRELSPPAVVRGLEAVDRRWAGGREAALLALAARGLTLLVLQVPRQSEIADPLAARAVAAVALAAAARQDVARERVLLAHHLGYTADAAALALALPPGDPVRLFAAGDSSGLRRAAERPDATHLVRYLFLLQLVTTGKPDLWRHWQRRQAFEPDLHSGVLGAGLDFFDFDADRELAPLVPEELYLEAARIAGRPALSHLPARPLALFGQGDSASVWNDMFGRPAFGGRARLEQFEDDIAKIGERFRGPFLDGPALALYFRAQLHVAFERTCLHAVRGLSSAPAALALAATFTGAPAGLWAETVGWCRDRAAALAGGSPLRAQIADLGAESALSDRALSGTLEDIRGALRYGDTLDVHVARRYFARLDSRPTHLERAGNIAGDVLYDVPLQERFFRRVLELSPADHPMLRVWWAAHRQDSRVLEALARDRSLDRYARLAAIRGLLRDGGDSGAARTAFAGIVAEDRDDWSIRRDFISLLERSGRFEDAASVAREWLAAHATESGFDRIFATLALARQYRRLGRPQAAWTLLQPLLATWQGGVMAQGALIAMDLGRRTDAETLITAAVRRYPDAAYLRATWARLLWGQGRNAEVPAAVRDARHPLGISAWREEVGPAFVEVFGHRPPGEAMAAFGALVSGGVPAGLLSAVAEAAADSGRFELAVTLAGQLPGRSVDDQIAVYRYVKRWQGEAAALDWLRQHLPGGAPYTAALQIYRGGQFDLLWAVTATPDQGREGSYLWILRALAARQATVPPDRARELVAHFDSPSPLFYDLAGRYVLGRESEAALLAHATDPHRSTEVSYYAGIRALGEGRYEDASRWLRVTVELGSLHDWEWLWAKDMLYSWSADGRALPIAARRLAERLHDR